jgi:hypothetical protein
LANNPRDYRAQLRTRLDRAKQIMDSASGRDLTYHERGQLADIVDEGRAIRA